MTDQTAAGIAFRASYRGFCRACRSAYRSGTMIARRNGSYVHETCPAIVIEAVASKPTTIERVGRYGTCRPADCDGPDCDGDCSYDSQRLRRPDARKMWREHTAEDMGW